MKRLSIISMVLLFSAAMLSSCSKGAKTAGQSSKTGMKYNDKNYGFEVAKKVKEGPGPGLIQIEGGTFVMGGSLNQDLNYDFDNMKRRVTVATFYMDETEVSNVDWREYLFWIRKYFPTDEEYYYNAMPDTLVWRQPLSYNEPYVNNYFRHPSFNDYPVVGITWEQAAAYCDWRTDRVNETILRRQGRLASLNPKGKGKATSTPDPASSEPFNTDIYLNGQYRGEGVDGPKMRPDLNPGATATETGGKKGPTRPDRIEDGAIKQPYRLPTEAEWEYAALALAGNTQYENIEDGKSYPWNGLGVRSPKKKTQGLILANFKRGAGDNMGVGGALNDKADITAPVKAYLPNDFGLYNMAGNVNEWVADVYRKLSFEDFEDFNPYRGNQFVDKRLADASKGVYAKDKYGKPIKDPARAARKQTWEELNKSRTDSAGAAVAAINADGKAYNPDQRGHLDTIGAALYGTSTMINNRSRVYKGGSWNDKAYWLNPATRRFMQQDESSAELGFRSAMTSMGNPEISSKGKTSFSAQKSKAAK